MALNYYTVSSDIQQQGWELLSKRYFNLTEPLIMKCPKGHTCEISYGAWRKNHLCNECAKSSTAPKRNTVVPRPREVNQRVLALDAATNTTGWAIFDDGKLSCYGTFNTTITDSTTKRINDVKNWIIDLCDAAEINAVGIENIQLQENPKIFQVLAGLQGVIVDALFERDYPYHLANSSEWRSYLGINHGRSRSEAKREAQGWVEMSFHIKPTQDEADAICMGIFFVHHFNKKTTRSNASWGEEII